MPARQAHFCLPCIGQDTGELFLKGPLVEAFYPRQTLTAEKASTVDTGYTTVVSILRISFLGAILARSQTPPGFLGELPKAVRKQNDLHLIYRYFMIRILRARIIYF